MALASVTAIAALHLACQLLSTASGVPQAKGPIGLLFQFDIIPYCWCPPAGWLLPPRQAPPTLLPQLLSAASTMEAQNIVRPDSMSSTSPRHKLSWRWELKLLLSGVSAKKSTFLLNDKKMCTRHFSSTDQLTDDVGFHRKMKVLTVYVRLTKPVQTQLQGLSLGPNSQQTLSCLCVILSNELSPRFRTHIYFWSETVGLCATQLSENLPVTNDSSEPGLARMPQSLRPQA